MTISEFLEAASARNLHFNLSPGSSDIRDAEGRCPVCRLAWELTGQHFHNVDYDSAAAAMGLDFHDACDIVNAADNSFMPDQTTITSLRQAMLAWCSKGTT